MEVSEATKNAFLKSGTRKKIKIVFEESGNVIENDRIVSESMIVRENIMDDTVEFVGCIASYFEIQIYDVFENIKGKKISVSISADGTEEVPLFHGIIDSAVAQSNKRFRKIVAYNEIYEKGKKDVATWYNELQFPLSFKEIRNSFFDFLEIEQVETSLPNDNEIIKKKYDPNSMKSLDVMKSICQINGVFGNINRYGKFEYLILPQIYSDDGAYPSITLCPPFFPGDLSTEGVENSTILTSYQSFEYEDWKVKPVNRLQIRQSENDAGVVVGDGENCYIIQGNMFTYGLDTDTLSRMAKAILPNIEYVSFNPFTGSCVGLPWLECGKDVVVCKVINYNKKDKDGNFVAEDKAFYVMGRELTGIQKLMDNYSAEGEEYQKEFITDVGASLDTIKEEVKKEVTDTVDNYDFTDKFGDYTYSSEEIDNKFASFSGGLKAVVVSSVPTTFDSNTIYFIWS